jgi:Asp-tRNA(Asn)/Glu-tRNA(Gln) amidotransferase A subunit family amidase
MADDLTATQTELHWLTIGDAARLVESRRLSPVELIDALLARIEALDPQILTLRAASDDDPPG